MEEIKLFKQAQAGNVAAFNLLIGQYKSLVYLKSNQFFIHGADKEDIFQEGMIGLIKAIRAYREDREASFITFATLCIKRQILTAIKTSNSSKNKLLNIASSSPTDGETDQFKYQKKSFNFYNPEEIFMSNERIKRLKIHLAANLSKMEKKIFELSVKGLDYIEIAEELEKTPKSIDNTIQRIKKKAKTFLKNYDLNKTHLILEN